MQLYLRGIVYLVSIGTCRRNGFVSSELCVFYYYKRL